MTLSQSSIILPDCSPCKLFLKPNLLQFATFRQGVATPLCVCGVHFTRLVSGEGDRPAELTPMTHSGVTVNADLVGAVRPEA